MLNAQKQKLAYTLFACYGLFVLSLTLFEMAIGRMAFFLLLAITRYLSLSLILCLIFFAIAVVALGIQCKEDNELYFLCLLTIPYTVFAIDNFLFCLGFFIVADNIAELISITYALTCLVISFNYCFKKILS